MSALETRTLWKLERKYGVVVWHRIYGCTENGEIINGMTYIVNGHVMETIWEK